MTEIELVKTTAGLRGWTDDDEAAWRKFKAWLEALEPGEFVRIGYVKPRNLPHHRKLFAALKLAYDHWDPASQRKRRRYKGHDIAKNFDAFRKDILILSGYFDPIYRINGTMELRARSIAFANMEQGEFVKCYDAVVDVLLQHILKNYTKDDVERVAAQMMEFTS